MNELDLNSRRLEPRTRLPTQMDGVGQLQNRNPVDLGKLSEAADRVSPDRIQGEARRVADPGRDQFSPSERNRQINQARTEQRAQKNSQTASERARKADVLRRRNGVNRPVGNPTQQDHVVRGRPDPRDPTRKVDRNLGVDHPSRKKMLQAEDGKLRRGRVERPKLKETVGRHTAPHMHPDKEPGDISRRTNVHHNGPEKGMPKTTNPSRVSRFRRVAKIIGKGLLKGMDRVLSPAWSLIPVGLLQQIIAPGNEA